MSAEVDYIGKTFGTLVVKRKASATDRAIHLRGDGNQNDHHTYWLLKCSNCGKTITLRSDHVRTGTKLCICQGGRG